MSISPISVERTIASTPHAIFDLLVQPNQHAIFDGSGTVERARSTGRRLTLGDTFGMDMKWGVPYSTRNVVTELEEDRLIAWRVLAPRPLGLVATGRTWRYELEPLENGTLVRETWDPRTEALPARWFIAWRLADLTRRNMERTLERIEQVVTGRSDDDR